MMIVIKRYLGVLLIMAIIIPSKNIFNIKNSKVLDNEVTNVEVVENTINVQSSNVLNKEYIFNFFDIDYDNSGNIIIVNHLTGGMPTSFTEGIKIVYSPYYPPIVPKPTTPEYYIAESLSSFNLYIDKLCNIKINDSGNKIISHKWFSKRVIAIVNTTTNEFTQREQITVAEANIVSYDKENKIVSVNYSAKVMQPISNNEIWIVLSDTFYIQGDYVESNNNAISYGNGTKSVNLSSTELLQDGTKNNNKKMSQFLAENILKSYKNGKEIAVILCSISDYKDTNGNKVIDITTSDKMMFDIGDEVIPYVYTANGVDVPMSIDKAGNAKVFRVVGTKPYYDGAVWQELTLQEK